MIGSLERNAHPVTIAYFGSDWEGHNRTSVHHVARWLGARYRVLYFECPGLRAPTATTRDLSRLWQKVRLAFGPPRRPVPNVEVRTLLQLPMHRFALVRRINEWLVTGRVRSALRPDRRRGAPVIAWFVAPHVAPVAAHLDAALTVYYCVDDFAAFPGIDPGMIARMESLLGRHADIVFVASATLMREKKALAPVVIHAPHGVDVAHFAPARQAPPRPIDLPEHGPIIGYFGSVADWIDLGLIQQLAERRPDWQFVLIGPISVAAERLPTAPNVRLLGRRPYEDLPTYGRHFDVAILPYRPTQQVLRANPIKLREYIAMEKPIVALPTPDILEFRDVVRTASTVDEWEAAVTDVLAEPDGRVRQERQRELAVGMSWDARLQAVHDEVMSRLDPIR